MFAVVHYAQPHLHKILISSANIGLVFRLQESNAAHSTLLFEGIQLNFNEINLLFCNFEGNSRIFPRW
jgi:hypothetical protein